MIALHPAGRPDRFGVDQLANHDPASALPRGAICPGDLICDALAVRAQPNVVDPPKAIQIVGG